MSRPDLGVGLTWSPGLAEHVERLADAVDVIEVEPETAWWQTGDGAPCWHIDRGALDCLQSLPHPKLVHGVSNPVGSARRPDPMRLRLFAETARTLGAVLASEHLAFNRAGRPGADYSTGFLLPPTQTWAGVEAAAASVRRFQAALDLPFSVETGVNYLRSQPGELPDGQFTAAVAERADCGILLDLHNVWTNARNGRQMVDEFLDQLPLERVWEVHLAGGMAMDGKWLDAHSGLTPPEVLTLFARVLPRLPALRAVVFELMPTRMAGVGVEALRRHLDDIRAVCRASPHRPSRGWTSKSGPLATPIEQPDGAGEPDPMAWEDRLGALVVGAPAPPADDALEDDPGLALLRLLVDHARASVLVSVLPTTCRLLASTIPGGFVPLLGRYFTAVRPSLWGSAEAAAFVRWLHSLELDVDGLGDALVADGAPTLLDHSAITTA